MKIKYKIQVTKPFLPPIEEYKKEIEKIWDTNWLTNNGPLHEEFNEKLSSYLKVENSTLFTNGHLALEVALKSFGFPAKSEIITTPFTFASTTHAIVNNNLKPVFCDINKENFTINVDQIEKLITDKTVAILPVHIFGYPCDVRKIDEIAKKYNLKVIYDAAHAFGLEINNKPISSFGDISMFSFHATKVFHSIEGGALAYSNLDYKKSIESIKNFGISGIDNVEYIGLNGKMSEFQAAMGIINLKYIDNQIEKRKSIVYKYRALLKKISGIKFLSDVSGVKHNYSYFPVIIDENLFGVSRDELFERLKEYNIFTRKYFYPLITDFHCYKNIFDDKKLINAKYISDRILTLPIYGDLKIEEVEYIVNSIIKINEK